MDGKNYSSKHNNLPKYDFLGSMYYLTKKNELKASLESILSQTYKPYKVVIVLDGFINDEVRFVLQNYSQKLPIKTIEISQNVGLGKALREGLKHCVSPIILRFDSDDINKSDRALKQVKTIKEENIDICSSYTYDFIDNPKFPIRFKKLPLTNREIRKHIFIRNPINHPSVAFKREKIISLDGGYRHCPFYEDYDLWIRAFSKKFVFKNLDEELVAMRIDNQILRRRGLRLVSGEFHILRTFADISLIDGLRFLPIFLLRIFIILLPVKVLTLIYKYILRKTNKIKFIFD